MTLENVVALSVAPEQPEIVIMQVDIFTSLLQDSFSKRDTSEKHDSSPEDIFDDNLDIDISSASFVESSLNVENNSNLKDDMCTRSFVLFEEAIATVAVIGDNVYLEIPDVTIIYTILKQLSPLCVPAAEARYTNNEMVLAAVSSKIMVSKKASQHLCGEYINIEAGDEKCLHLEVRAVESSSNQENSLSTIYVFNLKYYSPFDFQLMRNVTRVKHIQRIRASNSNIPDASSLSAQQIYPTIEFSVSKNDMKSRFRQVRRDNFPLNLFPRHRQHGVSVYTLLHLKVEPAVKRLLLKQYIDFPFIFLRKDDEKSLFPWNLYAQFSLDKSKQKQEVELSYHPILEEISEKYNGVSGIKHSQGEKKSSQIGVSTNNKSLKNELQTAQFYFDCLQREFNSHSGDLAQHGHFSFVEHNSEYGFISAQVAQRYYNASVVSLERDEKKLKQHVRMIDSLNIENNAVCSKGVDSDSTIFQRIYESPELFRYQLVARGLLESFANTDDMSSWGADLGCLLSSAVTTFLAVPSSRQVSLAMSIFFPQQPQGANEVMGGPYRSLSSVFAFGSEAISAEQHSVLSNWEDINSIMSHPTKKYRGFETLWLLGLTKAHHGSTEISFTPVYHASSSSIPLLIRCDIVNMTRHVHHHYDYAKDGHSRTYTMRVEVNRSVSAAAIAVVGDPSSSVVGRHNESDVLITTEGSRDGGTYTLPLGMHPNQHQIVSVNLLREKDSFPIPYTSIYGITLISILRLGIDPTIRDRLFKSFLFLPLYEDMAPWNIVLMGKEMAYIDYDTRDMTFDLDIPKAYQVISVLMNYKRTVEDFKRCGKKANTVYGLAFISDCVGEQQYGTKAVSCPSLKFPVPCGDGTCHSDYISCLRSYSDHAEALALAGGTDSEEVGRSEDKLSLGLAEAMRSGIGFFSN